KKRLPRVPQTIPLGRVHGCRRPCQFLSGHRAAAGEEKKTPLLIFLSVCRAHVAKSIGGRNMPVPQDSTVTIRFTGLLVFCFDKRRKICQIGALSKDDHELRFRMVKRGHDPESASERTLTIPHDLTSQSSELWLDVEGEP